MLTAIMPALLTAALHGGPMYPVAWAPQTEPTPSTSAAPPFADTPTPKRARMRGRGLAIATGAVGAAALSIGIGRAMAVRKCLQGLDDGDTGGCRSGGALTGLRAAQAGANFGTFGLAIATGVVAGAFDGRAGIRGERPERNSGAFIGGGIATIVGGVAIQIGGFVAGVRAFVRPECLALDGASVGHCLGRSAATMMIVGQVGTSVSNVGVGMLTYGIANRVGANRERRVQALRVAPNAAVSRGGEATVGLSISGRF